MKITCGIDWAEGHHDVALVNSDGELVAKLRIDTGLTGFSELMTLLAQHTEDPTGAPVAIETDKILLVAARRAGSCRRAAHRPSSPPAAAGDQRARLGRESPRPPAPGGDLGPAGGGEPAAVAAGGVLPQRPGRLPGAHPQGRLGGARGRADTGGRPEADPRANRDVAAPQRPRAPPRRPCG